LQVKEIAYLLGVNQETVRYRIKKNTLHNPINWFNGRWK